MVAAARVMRWSVVVALMALAVPGFCSTDISIGGIDVFRITPSTSGSEGRDWQYRVEWIAGSSTWPMDLWGHQSSGFSGPDWALDDATNIQWFGFAGGTDSPAQGNIVQGFTGQNVVFTGSSSSPTGWKALNSKWEWEGKGQASRLSPLQDLTFTGHYGGTLPAPEVDAFAFHLAWNVVGDDGQLVLGNDGKPLQFTDWIQDAPELPTSALLAGVGVVGLFLRRFRR